jgi:hypothetical protein
MAVVDPKQNLLSGLGRCRWSIGRARQRRVRSHLTDASAA